MAVNSSVEKQPVDQQASGEVQAEIDTRSDGVSPMPNDVSKHNDVSKRPVASIPESTLSLADIERKRSHPALWAGLCAAGDCGHCGAVLVGACDCGERYAVAA